MQMILPWIGSKRLLRKTITPLIPHELPSYIEPFGGAGGLFFHKDKWAKQEVYNDLDNRLVNLFLQIKFHPDAFQTELKTLPVARGAFDKLFAWEPLTELQAAARFFYLVSYSFGATGEHFASRSKEPQKSLANKLKLVDELACRLDRVMIENKPYQAIFSYYDRPEAFFYCDPPYIKGLRYANSKNFDHEELAGELARLKGKWLLSLDDCPEARELFRNFEIIPVSRAKGINGKYGDKEYKELLIANYDIRKRQVA